MSCIVVATDFSEASERALAPAVKLGARLGLPVVLVHVVEDLKVPAHGSALAPPQSSPEIGLEIRSAREQLERLAKSLSADVTFEVVTGDSAAVGLTSYARRAEAAYIAISTHGRTGLRHLVLGSVAEAVVRHSTVPVICYPPEESP